MSEHRFDTPGPVELKVTIPAGEISVQTIDGDESFVTIEGSPKLVEQTTVEQRGDAIVVEFHGKHAGISIAIGNLSFGGGRLEVRARVPHASRARLNSASADMTLDGKLESLELKTVSGDVRGSAEIEGDAAVKSVSGDVRLATIGGDLRVQSVSGDTTVRSIGGSLEAKSVSGDVRVESVRSGHTNATSISGDIEIGIAAGSNVDVDANSVSGELSSEVALASDPGAASFGDGPTVVVRGKTVSGDFRVFRACMRSLLRGRNARLLFGGEAISLFGDWALIIVLGIWAKTLTGSNAAAGLVFFVFAAGRLTVAARRRARRPRAAPAADGQCRRLPRPERAPAAVRARPERRLADLRRHAPLLGRRLGVRLGARRAASRRVPGGAAAGGERARCRRSRRDCGSSRRSPAPGLFAVVGGGAVARARRGDVRRLGRRALGAAHPRRAA